MTTVYIFTSVIIVSLISFVGAIGLSFSITKLRKILLFLVSFSAGALLAGAFIHLLPELIEKQGFSLTVSLSILGGMLLFFILEKVICWRHCHIPTSSGHPHPLGSMNLIGDGLHNFIDGLIIAAAFFINPIIGLSTTVAVILHEIPQEISDFGVLIYAGFSKNKALLFNFLTALTAILGATLAILFNNLTEKFTEFAIPLTIGGFIYIASADLIPELKKETGLVKSLPQLLGLALGVGIMLLLLVLE